MKGVPNIRKYHAVKWNEPVIYELSREGVRGQLVAEVEDGVKSSIGDVESRIPANMRRTTPPNLPEISEPEVMTHYLHLSQQTFGVDSGINVGVGTCTMKYNPKVNDQLARMPQVADIHPFQHEDTVQGVLEIMYTMTKWLGEITGMEEINLQPGGGSHAVYTNCCITRAYHKSRGELNQRFEAIVPTLSHPCNAAAPASAGFKVIAMEPDPETGCLDIEALKAVVSKHTAAMLLTDPYDTGVFDANIAEYAKIVHESGGLVLLDQANANSLIGVARAAEMGADMCHLNLHKTFSTPHGSMGPGAAPIGAREQFSEFMPVPIIEFDGNKYHLNYDRPRTIGKTRGFYGNTPNILKAYAWIMAMGGEGLREAAMVAVMNCNYMIKRLSDVRGLSLPFARGHFRMQEARFSWQKLKEDTGLSTDDLNRRIVDFGVQNYFPSHHPWIVPEPMTPEPTESVSKLDLDRFCDIIRRVSEEAYADPEMVRSAPHSGSISKIELTKVTYDMTQSAMTWRAFLKKKQRGLISRN